MKALVTVRDGRSAGRRAVRGCGGDARAGCAGRRARRRRRTVETVFADAVAKETRRPQGAVGAASGDDAVEGRSDGRRTTTNRSSSATPRAATATMRCGRRDGCRSTRSRSSSESAGAQRGRAAVPGTLTRNIRRASLPSWRRRTLDAEGGADLAAAPAATAAPAPSTRSAVPNPPARRRLERHTSRGRFRSLRGRRLRSHTNRDDQGHPPGGAARRRARHHRARSRSAVPRRAHRRSVARVRRSPGDAGVAPRCSDQTLRFDGDADLVRQVRIGRHPNNTTRVVLDAEGVSSYSVYPLYSPYRLVIDCVRPARRNHRRAGERRASAALRSPRRLRCRCVT